MPDGEVEVCGLCWSSLLRPMLDMGSQPVAERYDSDKRFPLKLLQCADCGLVQLSYIVPQADLFPPGHPYATGDNGTLVNHYEELADTFSADLKLGDLVVDIGANDGTLINQFRPTLRRIAVEPTAQINKTERFVVRYQKFFSHQVAADIVATHGHARVVTACNVLAHVPDPHDFVAGVAHLIGSDGLFVTENHSLASVLGGQFDTIYHEHLRYYDVATLSRLLAMHRLDVTGVDQTAMHGGSFRVVARKRHFDPQEIAANARSLYHLLADIKASGTGASTSIYGVGAATRAVPLIHYTGIANFLSVVCEVPGNAKIGLKIPGTSIRVVDEKYLIEDQPPYALLLAWHLAPRLIAKLTAAGYRGSFIVPLPKPKIINPKDEVLCRRSKTTVA